MAKIYLDQASTSYPKAPSVAQAVYDYLNGSAVNVNRGGYQAAYSVEEQIFKTREQLLRLFLTRHYRSIGTPFCSCGTVHPSGDHRAGAWCMHRVTDYKGISSERWFGTGYQIYTGSFCYDRMSDVPWVSVPNDSASGWW